VREKGGGNGVGEIAVGVAMNALRLEHGWLNPQNPNLEGKLGGLGLLELTEREGIWRIRRETRRRPKASAISLFFSFLLDL